MDDPHLPTGGHAEGAGARRGLLAPLALAVFAVALPIVSYAFVPKLWDESGIVGGDQGFHVYQLERAHQLGGRWWEVTDDAKLGRPYPQEVAKHPGMFEGVDLMLLSALTGGFLSIQANFMVAVLAVLVVNAGVVAWLVYRQSGSALFAAVGVALVTLNFATMGRMGGHLHLFKYCWTLIAAWRFHRYLEAPSARNGLFLGLSLAWVLQGAFYYGLFTLMVMGIWWAGSLIAGRLGRRHALPTLVAGFSYGVAAFALTFPVWLTTKKELLADDFANRPRKQAFYFSAELWQYFAMPDSQYAIQAWLASEAKPLDAMGESWVYLGLTTIAGLAVYLAARIRGVRVGRDPRFIDLAAGLAGLLALVSLTGGPAIFLHDLIPSLRGFARAGQLTLALCCVVGPVALHAATRAIPRRWVRASVVAALVAVTAWEGRNVSRTWGERMSAIDTLRSPFWCDWLRDQPADVKLAVLSLPSAERDYWYGPMYYRLLHDHATLRGSDYVLFHGDLHLVGAHLEEFNYEGLVFVASLGYEHVAIDQPFFQKNPWLREVDWIEPVTTGGDWQIFRVRPSAPLLPTSTVERLVADHLDDRAPVDVPVRAWITGGLDLDRTVVTPFSPRLKAAWIDASGRTVGKPTDVLNQHIFGPHLPAYLVRTPSKPGDYRLAFVDRKGRTVASKRYRVSHDVITARRHQGNGPATLSVGHLPLQGDAGEGPLRVEVRNDTPYYIQAYTWRENVAPSLRGQPGNYLEEPGSMVLQVRCTDGKGRWPSRQLRVLLPHDLPPGERAVVALPRLWPLRAGETLLAEVEPDFLLPRGPVGPPDRAEVKLATVPSSEPPGRLAGQPAVAR